MSSPLGSRRSVGVFPFSTDPHQTVAPGGSLVTLTVTISSGARTGGGVGISTGAAGAAGAAGSESAGGEPDIAAVAMPAGRPLETIGITVAAVAATTALTPSTHNIARRPPERFPWAPGPTFRCP